MKYACKCFNALIRPGRIVSLVIALGALTTVAMGASKTWYVSPTGSDSNTGLQASVPFLTIQKAVTSSSNGDTIMLEAGTYTGTGDVDIAISTELTITSQKGEASTTINCGAGHRAFSLSGTKATIENLTIESGDENDTGDGGAITLASDSTAYIQYCTFTNNTATGTDYGAEEGGAIFNNDAGGNLVISNCVFNSNSAVWGSAIWSVGGLAVSNCQFNSNTSQYETIASSGDGSIAYSTFSQNIGPSVLSTGSLTVTGCVFTQNTQAAVVINGGTGSIIGSTFENGSADAILNNNIADVYNCLFVGNQGAALDNDAAHGQLPSANFVYCTCTGNGSAVTAAGVDTPNSSTVTLENDICWNDAKEVLVENSGVCNSSDSDISGIAATNGNIDANPQFESPTTGNYSLLAATPCAGKAEPIPSITADLTGRLRSTTAPWMGAFEGGPLFSPVAFAVDSTGNRRDLWASVNYIKLWSTTSGGVLTTDGYASPLGTTPVTMVVAPDNSVYVLFRDLADDGVVVWNVIANGTKTAQSYAPPAGSLWTCQSLSVDGQQTLHIQWMSPITHQQYELDVPLSGATTGHLYGPIG